MLKPASDLPKNLTCDIPDWQQNDRLVPELVQFYWCAYAAFPGCSLSVDFSVRGRRIRVDLYDGPYDCSDLRQDATDGDLWLLLEREAEIEALSAYDEMGVNIAALARLVQRYLHGPNSEFRRKIEAQNAAMNEPDLSSDASLIIGLSDYRRRDTPSVRVPNAEMVILRTDELLNLYRTIARATL